MLLKQLLTEPFQLLELLKNNYLKSTSKAASTGQLFFYKMWGLKHAPDLLGLRN
jgi:hypothetical protein